MSLLVLASATGAPGVTTTALGLALRWPGEVLLVDADRQPAQSVLAGHLQDADHRGRGLAGVLQAHRERRPIAERLDALSLPLDAGPETARAFLPGFTHPGMVRLFEPAWPEFGAALAARPGDALVDAGRIGAEGLPGPLVSEADGIAVVTRTGLADLVALRLYLPLVMDAVAPERVGLILIGPGRPYPAGEITAQFGVDVWADLEWDPSHAAVLSQGREHGRGFQRSPLWRGLQRVASDLARRFERAQQRIGSPR